MDSISLLIASFQNGASGDFMASRYVVGVSSIKNVKKSPLKYFSILVLLFLQSLGSRVETDNDWIFEEDAIWRAKNLGLR